MSFHDCLVLAEHSTESVYGSCMVVTIKWFDGAWNSKWKASSYVLAKKAVPCEEEVKVKEVCKGITKDNESA